MNKKKKKNGKRLAKLTCINDRLSSAFKPVSFENPSGNLDLIV